MTLGSDVLTVNNKSSQMDTTAIIKDDRTFIPVRFVAEALGLEVEWLNDYLLKNGNILNRHPKVRPKSNDWEVGFFFLFFLPQRQDIVLEIGKSTK